MTSPVNEHFILPLSACFTPRPGQDIDLFWDQLRADLACYPMEVLKDAVIAIRRSHKYPTWPTIAECLDAVRQAASRHYQPPRPEPARDAPFSPRVAAGLRTLGNILAGAPRLSDPHFEERRKAVRDELSRFREEWRRTG